MAEPPQAPQPARVGGVRVPDTLQERIDINNRLTRDLVAAYVASRRSRVCPTAWPALAVSASRRPLCRLPPAPAPSSQPRPLLLLPMNAEDADQLRLCGLRQRQFLTACMIQDLESRRDDPQLELLPGLRTGLAAVTAQLAEEEQEEEGEEEEEEPAAPPRKSARLSAPQPPPQQPKQQQAAGKSE